MFGSSLLSSQRASGLSKEYFDLVKAIGESRSKQEEDKIIANEVNMLKDRLEVGGSETVNLRKEFILRALYCEMLGHDASFAHIHGIKAASDKNPWCKRSGYMLCGLILRPQNELLLLLVNTIQKDLSSPNYLDVASALTLCSQKLHEEAFPAILDSIVNLLDHSQDLVKKKALCALLHMYKNRPDILSVFQNHLKRIICQTNPELFASALELLDEIIRRMPNDTEAATFIHAFDGLVPSLASILREISDNKCFKDWAFQKVPAPWLQMKLLQILSTLVGKNPKLSDEVYEVFRFTLSRCENVAANISSAVVFECVKAVASIYPNPSLCSQAVKAVGRFIESPNKNLKVAGIIGLSHLVLIDPSYISKNQLTVIDCLDDRDETLRTEALKLLTQTTNSSNVVAVVRKLIGSAQSYFETDTKQSLITKALMLTERYAPSPEWYLETMTWILKQYSAFVPLKTGRDITQLIADGPTGDIDEDSQFRKSAVHRMLEVASQLGSVDDVALRVSHWVLGSYGIQVDEEKSDFTREDILDILLEPILVRRDFKYRDTYSCLVTALLNYAAQLICYSLERSLEMPWLATLKSDLERLVVKSECQRIVEDCEAGHKLREFLAICDRENELKAIYPFDGFSEDLSSEINLSLIDNCVESIGIDFEKTVLICSQQKNSLAGLAESDTLIPRASKGKEAPLKFAPYTESPVMKCEVLDEAAEFKFARGRASNPQMADPNRMNGGPFLVNKRPSSEQAAEFNVLQNTGRWGVEGLKSRTEQKRRPFGDQAEVMSPSEFPSVNDQLRSGRFSQSSGAPSVLEAKQVLSDQQRKTDDEKRRQVAQELFAGISGLVVSTASKI